MESAETPGDRLKKARQHVGLTVEQLAKEMKVSPSSIRAHENGQNGIRQLMAERYGFRLQVRPEWILFGGDAGGPGQVFVPPPFGGSDHSPKTRYVILMGDVQAGAWREVSEMSEYADRVAFFDPTYERASVFALRVVGRSMDQYYPDGTIVYVVPAHEAGVREGDHVVVQRARQSWVETTLKEVVINDEGKVELWPRSSDPDHQHPILLQVDDDDQDRPEITGVVVGSYTQRRGPAARKLVAIPEV